MRRNWNFWRYALALAVSLFLHLVLLWLDVGEGTVAPGGKGDFQVRIAAPENVTSNGKHDRRAERTFQGEAADVKQTGVYYYKAHEVDKRAEFIHQSPVAGLEAAEGELLHGRVKVQVLVSEKGEVDGVKVLEISPADRYLRNFLDAIWRSRFTPAERQGQKVKSLKVLEVEFDAKY